MNLGQAYQGWQQMQENRDLYVNTREAFRKAWFVLPTNKPCSWYTKEMLGQALAATREIESNKVKAASVMCHVLAWAHWAEPKFNPEPDFTYNDLMEYTKGPLADPKKIKSEDKSEDDEPLVMVKPEALASHKAEPEGRKPDVCDGCNNVKGCITCVNGDQWARIMEAEPKTNEDMEEKKTRGKQPLPVAQIDPKTLKTIKIWPSRSEAERELGACNIDRAIVRKRLAAGFYWCKPEDAEGFQPNPKSKPKEETRTIDFGQVVPNIKVFTDDELLAELDRRGWYGELSHIQRVTLGKCKKE